MARSLQELRRGQGGVVAPGLGQRGRCHLPLPHRKACLRRAPAQGAALALSRSIRTVISDNPSRTPRTMQPGTLLPETIGFIAAILTTLSFLPQALRIRRLRSADDVSLTMYLMMVTGQGLWLIYGIVIASPSMIGANVVAMSFVTWVLVMKLRHLRRMRDEAALCPPAPAE